MKYKKVAHYDYSTGKSTQHNTVERTGRARSGGVLGQCKCGGEIVVLKVNGDDLVCSCTKCGEIQYWELVQDKATKKAA